MRSQLSQPFGFRVPSQTPVGSSGVQSTKSQSSSHLSSHSSSLFLAPMLHGASSPLTSRAPSNCGSNITCGTQGDNEDDSQLAPLRWFSQLQRLAAAESHTSGNAPHNSRVHAPPSQRSSGILAQDQQSARDNDDCPSPPPRPVGICTLNLDLLLAPFNLTQLPLHVLWR